MWDTTGSERFSSLLPIYFRSCDLLVACFRVGDESSMNWIARMWKDAANCGVYRVLLVGTQYDAAAAQMIDNEVDRLDLRIKDDAT